MTRWHKWSHSNLGSTSRWNQEHATISRILSEQRILGDSGMLLNTRTLLLLKMSSRWARQQAFDSHHLLWCLRHLETTASHQFTSGLPTYQRQFEHHMAMAERSWPDTCLMYVRESLPTTSVLILLKVSDIPEVRNMANLRNTIYIMTACGTFLHPSIIPLNSMIRLHWGGEGSIGSRQWLAWTYQIILKCEFVLQPFYRTNTQ